MTVDFHTGAAGLKTLTVGSDVSYTLRMSLSVRRILAGIRVVPRSRLLRPFCVAEGAFFLCAVPARGAILITDPRRESTAMAAHAIAPSAAITRPAFVRCQRGGENKRSAERGFYEGEISTVKGEGTLTDYGFGGA